MNVQETIHYQRILYHYTSSIVLQKTNLQRLKFFHEFNLLCHNFLINEFFYSVIYLSFKQKKQKKKNHFSLSLSNVNLNNKKGSYQTLL